MTINPLVGGNNSLVENAGRGQSMAVSGLKNALESQKSSVGAVLDSIQAITFDQNGKVSSDAPGQNLNVSA